MTQRTNKSRQDSKPAPDAGLGQAISWQRHLWLSRVWWIGVCVVIFAVPYTMSVKNVTVMSIVAAYSLVVVGLVLLHGQGGQLSLGQSGFMAIGAFTSAVLVTVYALPPVLGLLAGVVLAVIAALLLGIATLRLRGLYFAVSTFGFATIISSLALGLHDLTGGPSGQIVGAFAIGSFAFDTPWTQYYLNWAILGISCVIVHNVLRSSRGRALRATGRDPLMASGIGVPVVRYKVIVFMVTAGLGAIGGSMYAHTVSFISAETVGPNLALMFVAMYFLGGANSLTGAIIGTGLLVWIPQLWPETQQYQLFIAGGLLLLILRLFPVGAVPGALQVVRKFTGPRTESKVVAESTPRESLAEAGASVAGLPLSLTGVTKSFGGLNVLTDCNFNVEPGKVTSIIGPNGAGKTTLLNIITRIVTPDAGTMRLGEKDITAATPHEVAGHRVARTYQTPRLFVGATVLDNVVMGAFRLSRAPWWSAALRLPAFRNEERRLRTHAMDALRAVGLERSADATAGSLPLGHQRLLEIARALASNPRFIALDEPAAGSNDSERRFLGSLVQAMSQAGITVLLIEHNMDMVMEISDQIVVLAQGVVIASGPPEEVRAKAHVIEAYLGTVPEGMERADWKGRTDTCLKSRI